MSMRVQCTHQTRRGRPCRNPATPGTNPPACHRHGRPAARAPQGQRGFYDAYLTAEELEALQQTATVDVQPEVTLVRVMLRRLLALFDVYDYDDVRKLSALIFTGTRTVALLLRGKTNEESGFNQWLNQLLDEFGEEIGVNF